MNPVRKLSRNPWVNRIILVAFVLWSGMLVCVLPNPGPLAFAHAGTMPAETARAWRSDCANGGATFCKSAGREGLLSNLHPFAAVSADWLYWTARVIPFAPARIDIAVAPLAKLLRIFLLTCVFLK